MTTPTTPEKRLLAGGVKKASTWGTAVALGATNGMYFDSDGGLKNARPNHMFAESDSPFFKTSVLGPRDPVDFNPSFYSRYDSIASNFLTALLFGTAGAPAQQGATSAYLHTIQWKDHLQGLFATFALEKAGKIFEVPSVKPYGLELSFSDGVLKGTISLRGDLVKDNSSTNTATEMDALTYNDVENPVRFDEGSLKMNAESGGDVASETALEINAMTLSFQRKLDSKVAVGNTSIIEPLEEGNPEVTIDLEFPRMSTINSAYFQDFDAETRKKMLIKFQGILIETTYYYTYAFYYPRLKITEIEYPHDDIIPSKIKLQAEQASSAPTGMTYTRPYIEITNKFTTDYLA